jgi:transcriptional regulator with XRE-family HTH domain
VGAWVWTRTWSPFWSRIVASQVTPAILPPFEVARIALDVAAAVRWRRYKGNSTIADYRFFWYCNFRFNHLSPDHIMRPAAKWVQAEHHQIVGSNLIAARRRADMTQVELAARLGKPQSFVSAYEVGKRRVDVIEFIDRADFGCWSGGNLRRDRGVSRRAGIPDARRLYTIIDFSRAFLCGHRHFWESIVPEYRDGALKERYGGCPSFLEPPNPLWSAAPSASNGSPRQFELTLEALRRRAGLGRVLVYPMWFRQAGRRINEAVPETRANPSGVAR